MIIVKISGGLGNQLFQFSFGRYLSIKLSTEAKFDIQTISNSNRHTPRSFGLGDLNLKIDIAETNNFKNINLFIGHELLSKIERKLVQIMPFLNRNYVVQNLYKSQYNKLNYRDNCYYDGYWQSEKYFEPIKDILRKELEFTPILNSHNTAHLNEIKSSRSVSIHIRRGDYISHKSNMDLYKSCSLEYYRAAIDYLENKIAQPLFYIFSDDPEWTKNNFKGEKFRIMDNNSQSPAIDLFLMKKCQHNIIANSSFSWWAAWLNSNSNKIVIAPTKWYNNNWSDKDIIPESWTKIDN